jgi:hypothetical protein
MRMAMGERREVEQGHACPVEPFEFFSKWLAKYEFSIEKPHFRFEWGRARFSILLHQEGWEMNAGRTVFAQLMDFLPAYEFRSCVPLTINGLQNALRKAGKNTQVI